MPQKKESLELVQEDVGCAGVLGHIYADMVLVYAGDVLGMKQKIIPWV